MNVCLRVYKLLNRQCTEPDVKTGQDVDLQKFIEFICVSMAEITHMAKQLDLQN